MVWLSVTAAATVGAVLLGTFAALARRTFRGKDLITMDFILPIALPGIVTGIALAAAFRFGKITPGFWTIAAGHTTFCIVVVYNNVIARLPPSLLEAAMDLGADSFGAFRTVILPQLSTALLAGGILAFGLSFDEIIVTTFTAGPERALPIWLLNQLGRPRDAPITNVVAVFVMLMTALPILGAWWLTRSSHDIGGSHRGRVEGGGRGDRDEPSQGSTENVDCTGRASAVVDFVAVDAGGGARFPRGSYRQHVSGD